jgi:hypothetical protein
MLWRYPDAHPALLDRLRVVQDQRPVRVRQRGEDVAADPVPQRIGVPRRRIQQVLEPFRPLSDNGTVVVVKQPRRAVLIALHKN